MRTIALAMLFVTISMLSACHQPQDYNAAEAEANEDAALNLLDTENNEAKGAGLAGAGLIPDENGQVPMANVR